MKTIVDDVEDVDDAWLNIASDLQPRSEFAKRLAEAPLQSPSPAKVPAPTDEIERRAEAFDVSVARRRMWDRVTEGDFARALEAADEILHHDPAQPGAIRVRKAARARLADSYLGRIGPLDKVPYVLLSPKELMGIGLDARTGFVLSRIDGEVTLEQILDMTGMDPFESLRILCDLLFADVIGLR